MAQPACGMDFGTSNSTFAVAGGNAPPRLLPLEGDSVTLPSVIYFSFETDEVHFGRAAVAEYVSGGDGRLMRSLKSVLGSNLFSDTTRIKRQAMSFADILGVFVGELRKRASTALGTEIEAAVLGRPVRFVDDDDAADAEAQNQLEAAARAEGFRHVEFQFEPIAAALDYEQQVTHEELGLVIDIGGGTSDFSVIRVSPERARASDRRSDILSTAGVHIGGTDFDRLLSLGKVMPLLGYRTETADGKRPLPSAPYYDLATWHRINRLYNQKTMLELRSTRREAAQPALVDRMIGVVGERLGHRLAGRVEEAKIDLTASEETPFGFPTPAGDIETTIRASELSDLLEDSVDRIGRTIREALASAEVGPDAIDTLILTGGSTQVPAVARRIRELLPAARSVATDAFGSVGLGLAIDAARRFGA